MEFTGHVQGAAAQKHAGFSYRVAASAAVPFGSALPGTRIKYLADFTVKIGTSGPDGMSLVQVWLMPNQHTVATVALLVCEFQAADVLMQALT